MPDNFYIDVLPLTKNNTNILSWNSTEILISHFAWSNQNSVFGMKMVFLGTLGYFLWGWGLAKKELRISKKIYVDISCIIDGLQMLKQGLALISDFD